MRAAHFLASLVLGAASGIACATPCALLDLAALRAAAPGVLGPLQADAPGRLDARAVPGLPVALELQQCTGAVTRAGAVTVRLALLSAPRALTAPEWQAVARALDAGEALAPAGVVCERQSPSTRSGQIHETGCSQARGRSQVSLSFEHQDAARLPDEATVRRLLAGVMARLP
jgi:hypothetical protein